MGEASLQELYRYAQLAREQAQKHEEMARRASMWGRYLSISIISSTALQAFTMTLQAASPHIPASTVAITGGAFALINGASSRAKDAFAFDVVVEKHRLSVILFSMVEESMNRQISRIQLGGILDQSLFVEAQVFYSSAVSISVYPEILDPNPVNMWKRCCGCCRRKNTPPAPP